MQAVDPLDGIWAKMARVDEHLSELNREVAGYLAMEPFATRGELVGDRFSVRVHIERPPPVRASVIVGDIVHNARSALDHLLWQVVLANGSTPTTANQWPILDVEPKTVRERRSYERRIADVSASVRERIRWTQPYIHSDSPDLHVMYALRELSNTDKHRLPLGLVAAIREHDEPEIDLKYDDIEMAEFRYGLVVNKPLESGDEFMFIEGIRVTGPKPHVTPSGTLPLDIAFGEVLTTTEGLLQIRDYVRMVVHDSIQLIEKPHQS